MRPFNMRRFGVAFGVGLAAGFVTFAVIPQIAPSPKSERIAWGTAAGLTGYGVTRLIQSFIPED